MGRLVNQFRRHTKRRLRERYGLSCTKKDLSAMVGLIKSGKSCPVKRKSINVTIHLITYQGVDIIALYNKKYSQIVTVFPNIQLGEDR